MIDLSLSKKNKTPTVICAAARQLELLKFYPRMEIECETQRLDSIPMSATFCL